MKFITHLIRAPKRSAVYNALWATFLLILFCFDLRELKAEEQNQTLQTLQKQINELIRQNKEQQQMILRLQSEIQTIQKKPEESALDRAISQLETPTTKNSTISDDLYARQVGQTRLRLIDTSLDVTLAAGASTENDPSLQQLQGGDHDPRNNGFTLQAVELSFVGAVDPYVNGEAHFAIFIDPEGETVFELEEAFLTTQALPLGFQMEAGQFLTEFGILNPAHAHFWRWLDQPIINSRFFGSDGIRGPGFRLGWLAPFEWFSQFHFGAQLPRGETMVSFLGNNEVVQDNQNRIGKRNLNGGFVENGVRSLEDLVYLFRWENSWDPGNGITPKFGFSALHGPNATGGDTWIYGGDLKMKWKPEQNFRGWPFVVWESEIMKRDYHAAPGEDLANPSNAIPGDTLHDWGLYTQLLYGFKHPWAMGLRYEYVSGYGESIGGRANDPFRDNRFRLAPLLTWYPTEYMRLRLQYNYDHADHLDQGDNAHSFWFGIEFNYGAHPAHQF